MELDIVDSYGWLEHGVFLSMSMSELAQLRLALSLAVANGIQMDIIEEFLKVTD